MVTYCVARSCRLSVASQCVFLNFTRPIRERLLGRRDLAPNEVAALAEHVTRFSLAGLAAARDCWQREPAAGS